MPPKATKAEKFAEEIKTNQKTGKVSTAILQTDDRVLARITDGIYRQPSSALRELIANAYDADATRVIIQTDAPRFDHITIRDNGNGMDVDALARLVFHIGGSSKRRDAGGLIGVTDPHNSALSPKGRRLIGKIGIGLFSVSQLTRHFQIITKVKGSAFRHIAEVILHTYTEDELASAELESHSKDSKFKTGSVDIVSVPAEDKESHGTEIILMNLRPQSKDILRSRENWEASESNPDVRRPRFHIGRFNPSENEIALVAEVPWEIGDKPENKFKKLYQGIIDDIGVTEQRPKLEFTLDNYLRTLWTLSLSAPIDYLEQHPFDLTTNKDLSIYKLRPETPGQAEKLTLESGKTVRSAIDLKTPERGRGKHPFSVVVDDVELFRPIRFRDLPKTNQAIQQPMLFVGKASPDLSHISSQERGGSLEFEAYFLWAPKIVPKENNGLLIRISDASGTLFDEKFAKYQVSELTRLTQITAEIFVKKGLDAALNIDRESFNQSHPHFQFLAKWVHRALRQITNTLKQVASEIRSEKNKEENQVAAKSLESFIKSEVIRITGDSDIKPTTIDLSSDDIRHNETTRKKGVLALNASKVFVPKKGGGTAKKAKSAENPLFREQIKAVAQILDAYGLLSDMPYSKQEELLRAIVTVFSIDKSK